ncbi:MAG: hypothetical protein AAF414_15735 [Pseudomonadota bacterium]
MTTVIYGPFRLSIDDANPADHPQSEKETVLLHAIYDCFPPPGSHGFIERPQTATPQLISRFLRRQESSDLILYAPAVNGRPPTLEVAIAAIMDKLDVDPLTITYLADSYKALLNSKPCYKATIYLRIGFTIREIKVAANVDLGKGADKFAKGDEIATFRVKEPKQFRFEKYYEFNKKCCTEEPDEKPETERTPWLPREGVLDLDRYGINPTWRFRINPEFRYKFDFTPRYRFFEGEDGNGSEDGDSDGPQEN